MTMLALGTTALGLTSAQPVSAASKKVYQKIPKAYRGTWKFKHAEPSLGLKKNTKFVIKARSVKGPMVGPIKGKRLGVLKTKKFVSFFLINKKGKQIGQASVMKLTHYKHKRALMMSIDVAEAYMTK